MKLNICCACGLPIEPHHVECDSGIFCASDQHLMHESCANVEEEIVNRAGTNNLPDRLKLYNDVLAIYAKGEDDAPE